MFLSGLENKKPRRQSSGFVIIYATIHLLHRLFWVEFMMQMMM